MKRRYLWLALIGVGVLGLYGMWIWFHSLPTESTLRDIFANAQSIEVVELRGGKPARLVRLDERDRWRELPGKIRYRQQFWAFSAEPDQAILLQAFAGEKDRRIAIEWRSDGCLHLRKAARWYRMPIEPGLEPLLRSWLAQSRSAGAPRSN